MSGWLQTAISPAMFAGVKGRGAQDAWMRAARAIESERIRERRVAATAFDMHKCYDQLARPMLYCVMAKAGWPRGCLVAMFRPWSPSQRSPLTRR
eukprot:2338272-Alexandrium_andersonii.AAC.1